MIDVDIESISQLLVIYAPSIDAGQESFHKKFAQRDEEENKRKD